MCRQSESDTPEVGEVPPWCARVGGDNRSEEDVMNIRQTAYRPYGKELKIPGKSGGRCQSGKGDQGN